MSHSSFEAAFLDTTARKFEDFVDLIEDIGESKLRDEGKIVWDAGEVEAFYEGTIAPKPSDLRNFLALPEVQERKDLITLLLMDLLNVHTSVSIESTASESLEIDKSSAELTVEQELESASSMLEPKTVVTEQLPQTAETSSESTLTSAVAPSPAEAKEKGENSMAGLKKKPTPFTFNWGGKEYTRDLSNSDVRQSVGRAITLFKGGRSEVEISQAAGKAASFVSGLKSGSGGLTAEILEKMAVFIGVPTARLLLTDKQYQAGKISEEVVTPVEAASSADIQNSEAKPVLERSADDDASDESISASNEPEGPDYRLLYAALVAAEVISAEEHYVFLFDHTIEDFGQKKTWQHAADCAIGSMVRRDVKDYPGLMKDPVFISVLSELSGLETAYLFHRLAEEPDPAAASPEL